MEHAPTCNIPELTNNIAKLRSWGVRIALDDVGLGQSNYRMMLDCDPEYFKLDAYFVQGLSTDSKRRAVVESLVALAKALESSVVAEGVASNEDLLQLEEIGVDFAQANLLCPAIPLDELLATGYLGRPGFRYTIRPRPKKQQPTRPAGCDCERGGRSIPRMHRTAYRIRGRVMVRITRGGSGRVSLVVNADGFDRESFILL